MCWLTKRPVASSPGMNDVPGGGGSGMMVVQPSTGEPPTLLRGTRRPEEENRQDTYRSVDNSCPPIQ